MVANIVSGVQELSQRSSIVACDDWLRKWLFKVPLTPLVRSRQIAIWTQDICGTQMIELSMVRSFESVSPPPVPHAYTVSSDHTTGHIIDDR